MDKPAYIHPTCGYKRCRCGAPAVRKIGEEIPNDWPWQVVNGITLARHNLTAYVCWQHFVEAFGPAAEMFKDEQP